MSNPTLAYAEVEGKDIQNMIWGRLMPAVEGAPIDHAVLGMLAFCVLLMKPDVELPTLQSAVQQATEVMILSIMPAGKENVN